MILSNEYTNALLDVLRGQPMSIPAFQQFYLGLVLINGTEITGASYSRKLLTLDLNTWTSTQGTLGEVSTGTTRAIQSNVSINYGTALESWGVVNRMRLFTASTGPNYFCDFTVPQTTINSGDSLLIVSGDIIVNA